MRHSEEPSCRDKRKKIVEPIVLTAQPESKDYLSIQEVSERVGIGRTKLYNEINEGRLKASKCGRQTLISLESFKKWVSGFSDY